MNIQKPSESIPEAPEHDLWVLRNRAILLRDRQGNPRRMTLHRQTWIAVVQATKGTT